jgi:CRP-like cAMP-binding protein
MVGSDGMVGISVYMGGETTSNGAVVQIAGTAYRVRADALRTEFSLGGEMQRLLLRYTQALMNQTSQTAICNRHHSIEQQLCRLLLLSIDRLPSAGIPMTQLQIASLLGVRREGVTEAAGDLKHAGHIKYRRGHITVLDRKSVEKRCCECYGVVRRETDRLFQASAAPPAFASEISIIANPTRRSRVPTAPRDSSWQ